MDIISCFGPTWRFVQAIFDCEAYASHSLDKDLDLSAEWNTFGTLTHGSSSITRARVREGYHLSHPTVITPDPMLRDMVKALDKDFSKLTLAPVFKAPEFRKDVFPI